MQRPSTSSDKVNLMVTISTTRNNQAIVDSGITTHFGAIYMS